MPAITTQQKYDEASAALHQLKLGRGVVSITDQNGEKLTFQSANLQNLEAYVDELALELGIREKNKYHPLKFTF